MNRSTMRELAFKLIYSLEIQKKEDIEEQVNTYIENNNIVNTEAINFIKDAVSGIENKKEEILEQIEKHLKAEWKIERISKIDLAILKLAIYEMLYKKLPYKVVINEAVELAKKYGEETSKKFVNGILASVVNCYFEDVQQNDNK